MKTLHELIEAGEKHHKTNHMVGSVVGVITIFTTIIALLTSGVAMWVFTVLALIFGVLSLMALRQHLRLKDHDKKLKEALPYAKEEQFDEISTKLKDKAKRLHEKSSIHTLERAHKEMEDYINKLEDRIKPLKEKGEDKLKYEEKIIFTLNQKAILNVRPQLRRVERLLLAKTADKKVVTKQ